MKGFCWMHYDRQRKGLPAWPLEGRARVLARFWPNVKKGPDCWEWTGGAVRGYGRMGANGANAYAHRVSYELHVGPIPEGMEVDHMCHNPSCVNPEHLRAVTRKQNTEHRAGANSNSKSGVRGVHWRKDAKKWQVTVHAGDKMHHGGYFVELEDAKQAAVDLRNKLFTHNNTDRRAA